MRDHRRSRAELVAELAELQERISALEKQRSTTATVLHGDPVRRTEPLVEQVPAIAWTLDGQLRLTWWAGGGIQRITDRPDQEIGNRLQDFLGSEDPEHPTLAAHLAALRGEFASYEYERNGVVMSAHLQPLCDAGGAIQGVIGVAIDITRRVQAERERDRLIGELGDALDRVQLLSGLIPICMHCKNVRNDDGYWEQVETWVRAHTAAEFTHAICPECMERSLAKPGRGAPR
jgi:hypothetical protein